jgi:hypothetical protein
MCFSKRFLPVLLAIVAAAFVEPSAARAASVELANQGIEPNASGQAKLSSVRRVAFGDSGDWYVGNLTILCSGLTANALYATPVGVFPASKKGNLKVQGEVGFMVIPGYPTFIEVLVNNGAGQCVLYGILRYK